MRTQDTGDAPTGEVTAAFSRKLRFASMGVVLLMAATVVATVWMARQQDIAAQAAARQMVAGGLNSFIERTKTTLLDYAIWTDAYDNIRAGDIGWITANIGDSDAFDLVVVLQPNDRPLGWEGGEGPRADLLKPEAIAAVDGLLDDVPLESDTAAAAYVRSGNALWYLAIARVVPQSQLPASVADAELPRLIIGFRVSTELFRDLGRPFMMDLSVSQEPVPGEDVIVLGGVDSRPLGWVSWEPPAPGGSVLRATLWPLIGLMIAVVTIVVLVSREVVRTASRLETALKQARAADLAKSEFLGNVSHELRTPLCGVIGIAQLLQMGEQGPEARHLLGVLLSSAHSQLRLVDELLDITRIEAGAIALERAPFDPAEVLEDTARLVAPDIEKKQLALRVAIAPDSRRRVLGDVLAFRQIATNLIGNAVKFTDCGSVEVELRNNGVDGLVLTVSDTGIGIDPAEHDRIFDRFVQVDGASTRRFGGAGLGLAITHALIEFMGGSIRVTSALGAGTVFTVDLPLPAADAVASAA